MKQQGQKSTSVSFSNHTLRQGLFATLALLVTLLGTQQYHYWNQPAEPLIHTLHSMDVPALNAVSATAAQASRLQQADTSDRFERPAETRWVF